ncbi:MAG: hypothetical protein JST40_08760 [Armatimonadetes bacterium]|nr:hypothetical protein [Armatimonadota bacterium]
MALFSLIPSLVALLSTPTGGRWIGYQYNTDDHMVYAAWMRQAIDGRWLFDNRFTTDSQPGLTFNIWFLVLGWLAKGIGIVGATLLAKTAMSFLFVIALGRLIERVASQVYVAKLALGFSILGGGIGFTVWHYFGQNLTRPLPEFVAKLMLGRQPIDIWQPEVFVVPSALTNGLFMVSLCLIVGFFICLLDARNSWKPVPFGALCLAILMNMHSYDVLLLALIGVAFLILNGWEKGSTGPWLTRTVVMALGVVPPALWFYHVIQNDPVFQARAATPTFSPNFRAVVFGILPGLALAALAWLKPEDHGEKRYRGIAAYAVFVLVLFAAAQDHVKFEYWMALPAWIATFSVAAGVGHLARKRGDVGWNLVVAWALAGLAACYFPALFQRKLAIGLAIPFGILAAHGVSLFVDGRDQAKRNLASALMILVFGGSSLLWLTRELSYIRNNVSNTTVHPVYMTPDMVSIVDYLNTHRSGRTVVLAPPGVPSPTEDKDQFATPLIPDLNPILSGFSGVYTFAGHWSETPDYNNRRNELLRDLYLSSSSTRDSQQEILRETHADYVVIPITEAFPNLPLADLRLLGEKVAGSTQFALIKVRDREQLAE